MQTEKQSIALAVRIRAEVCAGNLCPMPLNPLPRKRSVRGRGVRVLLAEDNDLNMEIARFMLENAGMEVTGAGRKPEIPMRQR